LGQSSAYRKAMEKQLKGAYSSPGGIGIQSGAYAQSITEAGKQSKEYERNLLSDVEQGQLQAQFQQQEAEKGRQFQSGEAQN